jgi:hypothetical protein
MDRVHSEEGSWGVAETIAISLDGPFLVLVSVSD